MSIQRPQNTTTDCLSSSSSILSYSVVQTTRRDIKHESITEQKHPEIWSMNQSQSKKQNKIKLKPTDLEHESITEQKYPQIWSTNQSLSKEHPQIWSTNQSLSREHPQIWETKQWHDSRKRWCGCFECFWCYYIFILGLRLWFPFPLTLKNKTNNKYTL